MKFQLLIRRLEKGKPLLALLVDPDKLNLDLARQAAAKGVSCILVGGSILGDGDLRSTVIDLKKASSLPIILFPGDESQLSGKADGLLLLSLLSGRNPEYLIEKHVKAAPLIKRLGLPTLPTAYLLVGDNTKSATGKITETKPLDVGSPGTELEFAL